MSKSQSFMVSHQPDKFAGHRHCGSGDIMILVCHVILQDHLIKGSCDSTPRRPSRQVTIFPSFVATDALEMEICF